MTNDFVKALCGAHKVELVAVTNHDPKDWFACPVCNVGDTRENVLREVGQHTKEVAARQFQELVRDTARQSKFMTFSGKTVPKGVYRFIGDFKL